MISELKNIVVLLVMIIGTSGCATMSMTHAQRTVAPLAPELVEYYRYTPEPLRAQFESMQKEPSSRWNAQHVTLEAPGLTLPIRIDWYAPAGREDERLPAVLIFPILWGNDLGVRDFAQAFAREGIHGIIVYRPKEKFSMEKPLSQIEEHFHTTVVNARRVVDWLETRPEVDSSRIGSLGISMGGTLNVVVAAVEPRIQRYVFCLPASKMAETVMTTKDRSIAKKRDEYLKRYSLTQSDAQAQLKELFKSEPLHFAQSIDPKKSLMVIALADRVVGTGNGKTLWRAMGKPKAFWIPTGHYTALFALPVVKLRVISFFQDWSSGKASGRTQQTAEVPRGFSRPLWPPTSEDMQK